MRVGTVRQRRTSVRDQRGLSLLENLVAVALVSLVLLGVISGMMTTINVSARNSGDVTANAALISVSERLKNQLYLPCATVSQLQATWPSPQVTDSGKPMTVTITSVRYWDPAPTQQTFRSTCASPDGGAQLVGLTVAVGSGRANGTVVIRNPSARAG